MTAAALVPPEWHRISGYLDQALDLEPQALEAWLEALATTQPGIVRTLRSLLAERETLHARGFLERSPINSRSLAALHPASMAGTQVGAYTIQRLLGRGGMGEVWLASRSDGRFEGQCAIKFLTESTAQVAVRSRRE